MRPSRAAAGSSSATAACSLVHRPRTTTGRCRRGSSTRPSRGRTPRCARSRRRPASVRARRGGRPDALRRLARPQQGGPLLPDDDATASPAQNEVDEVRWVPLAEAPALLSYARDATCSASLARRKRARATSRLVSSGAYSWSAPGRWAAGSRRSSPPPAGTSCCYDPKPGATDRALEAMERSLGKLAEKGGPPGEVLRVYRRSSTTRRGPTCWSRRSSRTRREAGVFRHADDDAARARDPRLEHELDPDRLARRGRPRGPSE